MRILYSILLILFSLSLLAEEDTKEKAQRLSKLGDERLYAKNPSYYKALEYYNMAYLLDNDDAVLNFKMGICYLNTWLKTKSIPYLETALKNDAEVNPEIQFLIGKAYQLNYEFDKAIESYNNYLKGIPKANLKSKPVWGPVVPLIEDKKLIIRTEEVNIENIDKIVKKRIKECENGKELVAKPAKAEVKNMGSIINTIFPEYSPVIKADHSELYITSRRPNTTGNNIDFADGQYYEDIFVSHQKDGKWDELKSLPPPVNTNDHDAGLGLSADGQTLFIYDVDNNGDILESRLKGSSWTTPEKLPVGINTQHTERSICISADERMIFFERDEEGGKNGREIYMAQKGKSGTWGSAKNLGKVINTEYDEDGVFFHPDGKTLYFSSKGHNSMGGYDIFKSVLTEGKWSKPENLGYPINGPGDDIFFVLSADGTHGYFSSLRQDGLGETDIYEVNFLKDADPEAPFSPLTLLTGTVIDANSKEPIEAGIEIYDNDSGNLVAELQSNSSSGEFLASLPSGKNYGIAITREDYLFHSENFNLPKTKDFEKVTKVIELKKADIGTKIILNNIFFDFNQASLRPESVSELNRMVEQLKNYKSLKIEIAGHTDNVGGADYNKKLSEERANTVLEYLNNKGISKDRLTAKGYGMNKPVAENKKEDGTDNPEGRQLNRRIEFEVKEK